MSYGYDIYNDTKILLHILIPYLILYVTHIVYLDRHEIGYCYQIIFFLGESENIIIFIETQRQ